MLTEQQEEQVIEEPMGDDDIRKYFPNAKIITYSSLNDFNDINELLPKDKDYTFLLIEDSPNKGHWVCVSKYGDVVEFFDSYGGQPDSQLKWNSKEKNNQLGHQSAIHRQALMHSISYCRNCVLVHIVFRQIANPLLQVSKASSQT
jgi:hypothetical protein